MTHEDHITFEQAIKLKELGFDWECHHWYHPLEEDRTKIFYADYYNHNKYKTAISAPTLSQVQKWFREVKGLDITINHVYHRLTTGDKVMYGLRIGNQSTFKTEFYMNYDSYEDALSIGIDKALEFLKGKK